MIQFHLGRDAKLAAEVVATHAASCANRSTLLSLGAFKSLLLGDVFEQVVRSGCRLISEGEFLPLLASL